MAPTLPSSSNASPPATDCSPEPETPTQQRLISGPLPLQQPIPSASAMPSSHKVPLASQSMATSAAAASSMTRSILPSSTNPYIEQFNSFITNQRKLHDEERALWGLERADLQSRIAELEGVVRRYRSQYGSTESSASSTFLPPSSQKRVPGSSTTLYNSIPSTRNVSATSTTTSAGSDGEPWQAPNNANSESHTATRSFSDVSFASASTKVASLANEPRRLSSIDEESKPIPTTTTDPKAPPKPSIDGAQLHPSLDGIMFKPTVLDPPSSSTQPSITLLAAGVSHLSTDSPSPTSQSPTTTSFRPAPLDLSYSFANAKTRSSQPTPQITLNPDDLRTKDAGHTPVPAKNGLLDVGGASPSSQSAESSPLTANFRFPPRAPRGSIAPPVLYRGRKGSRWPGADGLDEGDDGDGDGDEDPALRGPLGLQGGEGDHQFLSELNERLETAARSREVSPSSLFSPMGGFRTSGLQEGLDGGVQGGEKEGEKGKEEEESMEGGKEKGKEKGEGEGLVEEGFGVDQPEQEPRLRIKRSMNFGSQLCGKIE